MARPPETPPSSDIDGVEEDRQRIDQPKNSEPDPGTSLEREREGNRARPKDSRA